MTDQPRWRRLVTGDALVFAASLLYCLPACGIDLLDVYHLAQGEDPTFAAARHGMEAALQKIPEARAALLPAIVANGNSGRSWAVTSFSGGDPLHRPVNAWTWAVQLTQPLLRASAVLAYQQSQWQVGQALAEYAQAEQDLILRTAQAYFDVLVTRETIAFAGAQLRALEEQLAQTKRSFAAGAAAVTDVHEAQSKVGLATSQRVAALNDLEDKRAELEKLIGPFPHESLAALKAGATAAPPEPADPQAWVAQARTANPSVRAASAAVEAAQAEVLKNRAGHLPTLDLTVSYGSNYSSGSLTLPQDFDTRARTWQAGVQLNIPLYAGGATSAQVAEARANSAKAQAQFIAAQRQAANDARLAFSGVANGLVQLAALDVAMIAGKSAVEGDRAGYRAGLRINSDVLNAEQQLYAVQRDLAKARYDTLLQALKLKAAVGTLNEEDLAMINQLFAPPDKAVAN